MKFIEEIVVDEFLPTFRSMLAEQLREREHTQNEIAALLGISQSAVSKYVHGEVERNPQLSQDPQLRTLVEQLAEGLASETLTPVEALIETEVVIRNLERGGTLAELHAEAMPELAAYDGDFDVHDPESPLREAGQVRASVRRGLRIIRNTYGFAERIPAVGSNLVESLSEAEGIEDVAGVPGRILAVHGRVMIPGEPEFGVSQHVATVLLTARAHGSDARAALNVAYDADLLDALVENGHTPVEFDAERGVEGAIADALDARPDADVLYQTGGFGIEPVLYILSSDAPAVANTVRRLDA